MSKKEQILLLRSEGKSYKQIKEITGASLGTISFHCAPDQKEKTQVRARDRRNKKITYLQEYKADKPCMDCGELYPYYIMELDHVRGKKKGNLSSLVRLYSLDVVKKELEKCDLVCANCHRFRTWNRITTSGASTLEFVAE